MAQIIYHSEVEQYAKLVKSFKLLNRWLKIYNLVGIQDSDNPGDVYFNVVNNDSQEVGYYTIRES